MTVIDDGTVVPGARVCLGTATARTAFGQATTNADGVALLPQAPAGAVVTAGHLDRGGARAVSPATSAVTLTLAVNAPQCTETPSLSLPQRSAVPGSADTVITPAPIVIQNPPPTQNPPAFSPVTLRAPQHCFGALGAECGGAQFGLPVTALCSSGSCWIDGGSWRHDECCAAHAAGMACRNGPLDQLTGHDGNCVNEWNRALAGINYAWRRQVDFNETNATGTVVFREYCALAGSRIHRDDVEFCCSRQAHTEQVASKFADPNVRICN